MFSFPDIFHQQVLGNTIESYCWFAGIILSAFIFKRYLSKILSRLLFRLFKKFAAEVRGEKFVELLLTPVELLVLFIMFYLAVNQLTYPLDERIFEKKSWTYLLIIDKAFLLSISFAFTWMVLRVVDFVALVLTYKAAQTESKMDDQLVPFFKESAKVIIGVTSLFIILGAVFEVNVASLIAGLGIGGLALALAAKESLENLLASFTIFLDKPFIVGDLIKIDGIEGSIEKVGFRSTKIRTTDKSMITLPNRKMIDGALDNLTLRTYRRVKFSIGISYGTSADKIRKICDEIQIYIDEHKHTSHDGIVIFENFGEYSFNIMILYFIQIMEYNEYMKIKEDINFRIMEIVKSNGAEFAFPARVVYQQQVID